MKRKYYIKKLLYFLKEYWNINVENIRFLRILHKILSRPLFKSACVLKRNLPRLTSSKVGVGDFLATLKQITQSYSSGITDCEHDFEKRLESTLK